MIGYTVDSSYYMSSHPMVTEQIKIKSQTDNLYFDKSTLEDIDWCCFGKYIDSFSLNLIVLGKHTHVSLIFIISLARF